MRAIRENFLERGSRQQASLRTRMLVADGVVVRVVQDAKFGTKGTVTGNETLEHKGLEEPRGMREVPLDRTGVRHRLQRAVLRRQRRGKLLGRSAQSSEALRQ